MPELGTAGLRAYSLPGVRYTAPRTQTFNPTEIVPDTQGASILAGSAASMNMAAETIKNLPEMLQKAQTAGRKEKEAETVSKIKADQLAKGNLAGFKFGSDGNYTYEYQDPALANQDSRLKEAQIWNYTHKGTAAGAGDAWTGITGGSGDGQPALPSREPGDPGTVFGQDTNIPGSVPTGFTAKATTYNPTTPDDPRYAMEGGKVGAAEWHGKPVEQEPLHTLEAYQAGQSPYVSVAMDNSTNNPLPYGTILHSPQFPGTPFRVMDTGSAFNGTGAKYGPAKGLGRVDIARDRSAGDQQPETNGHIQFEVAQDQSISGAAKKPAPAAPPPTTPVAPPPPALKGFGPMQDVGSMSAMAAPQQAVSVRPEPPAPATPYTTKASLANFSPEQQQAAGYAALSGMPAAAGMFTPTLPEHKEVVPIYPGNIDLAKQPRVQNADGSYSTVDSFSRNIGGNEVLLSTITQDGRRLTPDEATQEFLSGPRQGQHLGIFATPLEANEYAQQLHQDYADGKIGAPETPQVAPAQASDLLRQAETPDWQANAGRTQAPGRIAKPTADPATIAAVTDPNEVFHVKLDGAETLLSNIQPDGSRISDKEAIEKYGRDGRHLGKFQDAAAANAYRYKLAEENVARAQQPAPLPAQAQTQARPAPAPSAPAPAGKRPDGYYYSDGTPMNPKRNERPGAPIYLSENGVFTQRSFGKNIWKDVKADPLLAKQDEKLFDAGFSIPAINAMSPDEKSAEAAKLGSKNVIANTQDQLSKNGYTPQEIAKLMQNPDDTDLKAALQNDPKLPVYLAQQLIDLGGMPYGKTPQQVQSEIQKLLTEGGRLSASQADSLKALRADMRGNKPYTDIQNVKQAYTALLGAEHKPSAISDVAVINSFQRIIDPGVSVREGDVKLVQDSAGLWNKIGNIPEILAGRARIPDSMRKQIYDLSKDIYKSKIQNFYNSEGKTLVDQARALNVPTNLLGLDFGIPVEGVAVPGSAPAAASQPNGNKAEGDFVIGKRYPGTKPGTSAVYRGGPTKGDPNSWGP